MDVTTECDNGRLGPNMDVTTECDNSSLGPIGSDKENDFGQSYFENIPVEILLHICSFLDAKFISETLSVLCLRFHDILSDERVWKARVVKRCNKGFSYPAIPVTIDEFDWQHACIEVEYQYNFWKTCKPSLKHFVYQNIHIATVDAVHLMKNASVCVSGSRDRSIVVWNISHIKNNEEPVYDVHAKAHQGWIWNFTSFEDKLYSCSWDTKICCWSIEETLQESASFKCDNAVLTVAVEGNALAAGLYNSKIVLFDVRISTPVCQYAPHKRSVLSLTMDSQYIISASEDHTVAVWDQHAGKIFKDKLILREGDIVAPPRRGFPMCLSYKNNQLYIGDSKGLLHLVDARHGEFKCVKSYDVGHTNKLTAVQHDFGYLITSSLDSTIRVFTPTTEPELITVLESRGGEVTKFDYKDNVLAYSGTNNAIELLLTC